MIVEGKPIITEQDLEVYVAALDDLYWNNGSYKKPRNKVTLDKFTLLKGHKPTFTSYHDGIITIDSEVKYNYLYYKGHYYFMDPITVYDLDKYSVQYSFTKDYWMEYLEHKPDVIGDLSATNDEELLEKHIQDVINTEPNPAKLNYISMVGNDNITEDHISHFSFKILPENIKEPVKTKNSYWEDFWFFSQQSLDEFQTALKKICTKENLYDKTLNNKYSDWRKYANYLDRLPTICALAAPGRHKSWQREMIEKVLHELKQHITDGGSLFVCEVDNTYTALKNHVSHNHYIRGLYAVQKSVGALPGKTVYKKIEEIDLSKLSNIKVLDPVTLEEVTPPDVDLQATDNADSFSLRQYNFSSRPVSESYPTLSMFSRLMWHNNDGSQTLTLRGGKPKRAKRSAPKESDVDSASATGCPNGYEDCMMGDAPHVDEPDYEEIETPAIYCTNLLSCPEIEIEKAKYNPGGYCIKDMETQWMSPSIGFMLGSIQYYERSQNYNSSRLPGVYEYIDGNLQAQLCLGITNFWLSCRGWAQTRLKAYNAYNVTTKVHDYASLSADDYPCPEWLVQAQQMRNVRDLEKRFHADGQARYITHTSTHIFENIRSKKNVIASLTTSGSDQVVVGDYAGGFYGDRFKEGNKANKKAYESIKNVLAIFSMQYHAQQQYGLNQYTLKGWDKTIARNGELFGNHEQFRFIDRQGTFRECKDRQHMFEPKELAIPAKHNLLAYIYRPTFIFAPGTQTTKTSGTDVKCKFAVADLFPTFAHIPIYNQLAGGRNDLGISGWKCSKAMKPIFDEHYKGTVDFTKTHYQYFYSLFGQATALPKTTDTITKERGKVIIENRKDELIEKIIKLFSRNAGGVEIPLAVSNQTEHPHTPQNKVYEWFIFYVKKEGDKGKVHKPIQTGITTGDDVTNAIKVNQDTPFKALKKILEAYDIRQIQWKTQREFDSGNLANGELSKLWFYPNKSTWRSTYGFRTFQLMQFSQTEGLMFASTRGAQDVKHILEAPLWGSLDYFSEQQMIPRGTGHIEEVSVNDLNNNSYINSFKTTPSTIKFHLKYLTELNNDQHIKNGKILWFPDSFFHGRKQGTLLDLEGTNFMLFLKPVDSELIGDLVVKNNNLIKDQDDLIRDGEQQGVQGLSLLEKINTKSTLVVYNQRIDLNSRVFTYDETVQLSQKDISPDLDFETQEYLIKLQAPRDDISQIVSIPKIHNAIMSNTSSLEYTEYLMKKAHFEEQKHLNMEGYAERERSEKVALEHMLQDVEYEESMKGWRIASQALSMIGNVATLGAASAMGVGKTALSMTKMAANAAMGDSAIGGDKLPPYSRNATRLSGLANAPMQPMRTGTGAIDSVLGGIDNIMSINRQTQVMRRNYEEKALSTHNQLSLTRKTMETQHRQEEQQMLMNLHRINNNRPVIRFSDIYSFLKYCGAARIKPIHFEVRVPSDKQLKLIKRHFDKFGAYLDLPEYKFESNAKLSADDNTPIIVKFKRVDQLPGIIDKETRTMISSMFENGVYIS